MTLLEFCEHVGEVAERRFRVDDSAELCYNLIDTGYIKMAVGVEVAAGIVAEHTGQYR